MNRIILLIICCSFILNQEFIPGNQSILNYTQVLFTWPQINGSYLYKIYLNDENIYIGEKNSFIIEDIDWATDYIWIVCGFTEFDEIVDCYEEHMFSTNDLPTNYPSNINIYTVDQSQYTPGITMLDYESLNFSVAVDINGDPVWFSDRNNFHNSRILVTQFLSTGNIIGFGAGKGYEFDLNSEIIFETPSDYSIHHYIHKTHNGTYFFIDTEIENHPCPIECDTDLPDEIPWQGDSFIEVDKNGNLLWEWNTFDYLSLNEYNSMWVENYSGLSGDEFDWTHSNSVYFDELTNMVYISMRNLSRISAIDYLTKEIIWNLGNPDHMEQQFFENYFGFSHQHSAQINYNNNLLFFDNGRDNEPELSRCLEIEFFENDEPNLIWEYILPDSLLTLSRGECDRLLNDHTLVSVGRTGNVIELNEDNEIIWHFNAKENSSSVSIFRAERIENLYPTAFSFEINNLQGLYGEYNLSNNQENISLNIFNHGWIPQNFKYQLFDINNNTQYEGEVYILQNNQINVDIEILNNGSNSYVLKVFPSNNSNNFQEIIFINETITGDLNGDSIVDILDLVIAVNFVLSNQYNSSADLNLDSTVNVLDVIQLVNIILS